MRRVLVDLVDVLLVAGICLAGLIVTIGWLG